MAAELDEVRRKNAELSESLSQVKLELELLKLAVNTKRTSTPDLPPGAVSDLVQEIYAAQREWQDTMVARNEVVEKRREFISLRDSGFNENSGASSTGSELSEMFSMHNECLVSKVERLRQERDALLEVLSATKEKLENVQIAYSLHKCLMMTTATGGNSVDDVLHLRQEVARHSMARTEAEDKCCRLERLVSVLQQKLRCKS